MARIRTIKPEFPHSESIGKLSRDARLLFIMLWTLVDDDGRARAASRMLASLLFPYDDDAPALIADWLSELEHHGLIRIYDVDFSRYLEVVNWRKHQKIDHPRDSRLPSYEESLATPREDSRKLATDLGPRTRDLGPSAVVAVDARTDGSLSEAAFAMAEQIHDAVGWDRDDMRSMGTVRTAQKWLNGKWQPDICIEVVRRVAQGKTIKTLKYFEDAIAEAHAKFVSPLPVAQIDPQKTITVGPIHVENNRSASAGADRVLERLKSFDIATQADGPDYSG